jgi:hypothetical protein
MPMQVFGERPALPLTHIQRQVMISDEPATNGLGQPPPARPGEVH